MWHLVYLEHVCKYGQAPPLLLIHLEASPGSPWLELSRWLIGGKWGSLAPHLVLWAPLLMWRAWEPYLSSLAYCLALPSACFLFSYQLPGIREHGLLLGEPSLPLLPLSLGWHRTGPSDRQSPVFLTGTWTPAQQQWALFTRKKRGQLLSFLGVPAGFLGASLTSIHFQEWRQPLLYIVFPSLFTYPCCPLPTPLWGKFPLHS